MNIDDIMHLVYHFSADECFPRGQSCKVCSHCGEFLETYYCESKLYLVRCKKMWYFGSCKSG